MAGELKKKIKFNCDNRLCTQLPSSNTMLHENIFVNFSKECSTVLKLLISLKKSELIIRSYSILKATHYFEN